MLHSHTDNLEKMSKFRKWSSKQKLSPETDYRTWIASCLADEYGYPRVYIDSRLKPLSFSPCKGIEAAFALLTPLGLPYAAFAIGSLSESKAKEWICYALEANPDLQIGLVMMAKSGSSVAVRKNFFSQKIEDAQDFQSYLDNGEFKKPTFDGKCNPLSENVDALFFEAHCRLRDIDGLHPDEALDELCKIIYAKLYDEKKVIDGKKPTFLASKYVCADECASSIRSLFAAALAEEKTDKHRDADSVQNAFTSNLRLSSPAILSLVRAFQPFSFSTSQADIKGRAFQKVLGPTFRQGLGQYFTPEPVVRMIVESVCPNATDRIIDPFCGSGHFLSTSLSYIRNKSKKTKSLKQQELVLDGIEKSERMVRVAITDVRLTGDNVSNILLKDALLEFRAYKDIYPESYDLVLTNPPFGSILSGEALHHLAKFELAKGGSAPLEILGLERSVQLLKLGGRLAIVLPDGILANPKTLEVRKWLTKFLHIGSIVSLPLTTFSPFGANIKTSIVFAKKVLPQELSKQGDILMLKIEEIGYDATGRVRENSEVDEAVMTIKKHFKKIGW